MKKIIFLGCLMLWLSSCKSIKLEQIGNVNMISTRNINPNSNFVMIRNFANSSEKELKQSEAKNIEEAINELVKKTPGGEFLTNAKLYTVINKKQKYYAVSGDVWGISGSVAFKGFKIGDKVVYKKMFGSKIAIIEALKDDKTCFIKVEGKDKTIEVEYEDLTKAE